MEVESPHDNLKRLLTRLQTLYQQDDQFVLVVTQAVSPELSQISRMDRLREMFKISFDSCTREEIDKLLKNASAPLQLLMEIQQIQDALFHVTDFVLKHIQDNVPKGSSPNDNYMIFKNLQDIYLALSRGSLQQLRTAIMSVPRHAQRHKLLSVIPTIPTSSTQLVLTLLHLPDNELEEFKQWIDNLSYKKMSLLAHVLHAGLDLPLVKKKLNDYNAASLKRPHHYYPIDDDFFSTGDEWFEKDEAVHKKEKLSNSLSNSGIISFGGEDQSGYLHTFNSFMLETRDSFPSTWAPDTGFNFDSDLSSNFNSNNDSSWIMNVCSQPPFSFSNQEFSVLDSQVRLDPFTDELYNINNNNNNNTNNNSNSKDIFVPIKEENSDRSFKSTESRGLSGRTYDQIKKEKKQANIKQEVQPRKDLHKLPSESIKTSAQSSNDMYQIAIQTQPPFETVYNRILKPPPTVMVTCNSSATSLYNLYVEVALIREDTQEEFADKDLLQGPRKISVAKISHYGVFDKLKISQTSLKVGCHFALKFVLLKFENAKFIKVPKFFVISRAIEVFSHTVYLSTKNNIPEVKQQGEKVILEDVIPPFGYCTGNQRVAILGQNFVDNEQIYVQFGNTNVKPEFYDSKTLVCATPPYHNKGIIPVRVHIGRGQQSEEFSFEYI